MSPTPVNALNQAPVERDQSGDLPSELRRVIEALQPDLRRFFRPELSGLVTACHDDPAQANYYTVDVEIPNAGPVDERGERKSLFYADVPVDSLWAHDGYGVFALPEEGSEVSVGFTNWEDTQPHVISGQYRENKAPQGWNIRAGSLVLRGKHGQEVKFSGTSNELVLSSASLKMITTEKRQEHTAGDLVDVVQGDRSITVGGDDTLDVDGWEVKVAKALKLAVGSVKEVVAGAVDRRIGAGVSETIGGSLKRHVLGGLSQGVMMNKKEIIGGAYEIIVAGTQGIAPPITAGPAAPQTASYKVVVNFGGLALDCLGGQIDLGAGIITPPTMINLGGVSSGPLNLGGISAVGQGVVHGPTLLAILTQLLTALQQPLGVGNLGAPIAPNPAFAAQIAALQGQVSTLLSTKVFAALV